MRRTGFEARFRNPDFVIHGSPKGQITIDITVVHPEDWIETCSRMRGRFNHCFSRIQDENTYLRRGHDPYGR